MRFFFLIYTTGFAIYASNQLIAGSDAPTGEQPL